MLVWRLKLWCRVVFSPLSLHSSGRCSPGRWLSVTGMLSSMSVQTAALMLDVLLLLQVGTELELVSKDERELESSRAELEALLTQQRSAHASSADCSPSTSSPGPSQEQGRGSRQIQGGRSPKQAPLTIQTTASGETQEGPQGDAGGGTAARGDSQGDAGKGASSPRVRQKGGPPFASISGGARAPKGPAAPGAAPEQQRAAAAVQDGSDAHKSSNTGGEDAAAGDQAAPENASNGAAAAPEADARAHGGQGERGALQDGASDAPHDKGAKPAGEAAPANGRSSPVLPAETPDSQVLRREGAASSSDGRPAKRPRAEPPARVAWVHGKSAGRPLRVAAGGSLDALRQRRSALSRGAPLPPAAATRAPDQAAAPTPDQAAVAADHTPSPPAAAQPDGCSGADRRGAEGAPGETHPPDLAAPAPAQGVDEGNEDGLAAVWGSKRGLQLSSGSWGARAYAGPEGGAPPAQGGGTGGVDRWRPRRPLRRTARSGLRHGRYTLQARASVYSVLPLLCTLVSHGWPQVPSRRSLRVTTFSWITWMTLCTITSLNAGTASITL